MEGGKLLDNIAWNDQDHCVCRGWKDRGPPAAQTRLRPRQAQREQTAAVQGCTAGGAEGLCLRRTALTYERRKRMPQPHRNPPGLKKVQHWRP